MSNISVYDELDQAIDQMLAAPDAAHAGQETEIGELVELAADLRALPRANFKSRLKLELEWEATGRKVSDGDTDQQAVRGAAPESGEIMPSLFGKTLFEKPWAGYPVRRINFALSVALHGVMALLVGGSFLMVKSYVLRVDLQP